MVNLNYQSFGTGGLNLRLRFYCNGETRYVNVNRQLKGNLLKRHWNQKKQCFIPSAPESEKNNEVLKKIIAPYLEEAESWDGDLRDFMERFKKKRSAFVPKNPVVMNKRPYTMKELMAQEISAQMTKVRDDGTLKGTYEMYEKADKRLREFCEYKRVSYNRVMITDIDANFINSLYEYMDTRKKGGRFTYLMASLKAVLNKAWKNGWYDIGLLRGANWRGKALSTHKYKTLTKEQCKRFVTMTMDELPKPHYKHTELMRDFCVFILFTCQSPCDAICLKYENVIDGNIMFKRRKISEKQHHPCMVPVNSVLKEILDKYKGVNKDGYIFPIRTEKKIAEGKTNNGDIKKFISRCNTWLGDLGMMLGCKFKLHLYTFRHTGITNYMNSGADYLYISELAGTDVKNLKSTYYNCLEDDWNRNKVLSAVNFD